MPGRLAGQLVDGGDPVTDEPVFVVDTGAADESDWSIVATDRSAGDGSWSVTVPNADAERYHAVAQFEGGATLKNALSKPFLTSQPFAQAAVVSVGFDVLSPAVVGSAIPLSVTDYWRFDEGSGQTAANVVSERDLDIIGADWQSDSESLGEFHLGFDGADDVAQNDDTAPWNGLDAASQAVWIRPDDLSSRQFVAGGTDSEGGFGSGSHWCIAIEDDGELVVQYNNFTTFDVLTQGEWIHVAVRYSDAEGGSELFINGDFEGSVSESGDLASVDGYSVGGPVNGDRRFFDGAADAPYVGLGEYWDESTIQEIYADHPRSE